MQALFHTNRGILEDATGQFQGVAGWWGDRAATSFGTYPVTGRYLRTNASHKLKHKWNLPQSLKYDWALNATGAEFWLLVDTDTVFQCTPDEIRDRFERLNVPLLVGTERWWFPQPAGTRSRPDRDPFSMACGQASRYPDGKQRPRAPFQYPNSGMVLGTRQGFATLVRTLHDLPGYPCCSCWEPNEECFVDDQACLQAALLKLKLATWAPPVSSTSARASAAKRLCYHGRNMSTDSMPLATEVTRRRSAPPPPPPLLVRAVLPSQSRAGGRRTRAYSTTDHVGGGVDYALDVQASLFLNLFMVTGEEIGVNHLGQLTYTNVREPPETRRPVVPCIIHTNAYKSPMQLRALVENWTRATWVPARATRIQRWLLDKRQRASKQSNVQVAR